MRRRSAGLWQGAARRTKHEWLPKTLFGLALVLTVFAGYLRWDFVSSAGGLWRDEVNTVNVACEPSWRGFRYATRYDSFALVWQFLTRLWAGLGFCENDAAWRALGLALGLAQLGGLWVAARLLGVAAPIWSLLLFGCNSLAASYGASVRGYGLGALAVCLTLATTLRFLRDGTLRLWGYAAVSSLAAVQTYLPNGALVAAVQGVAAVAAATRAQWRRAAGIVALTGIATLSLAANAAWISYALEVGGIEQRDVSWSTIGAGWLQALGGEVPLLQWTWILLFPLLLVLPWWIWRPSAGQRDLPPWILVGCAAAILLSHSLYLGLVARLGGLPWYYLAAVAVLALTADLQFARLPERNAVLGWILCGVASLVAALSARGTLDAVRFRLTSVDQIAAFLTQQADEQDLVLVLPWYAGIPFQRYYRGQAPWQTVPPLQDHRYHLHMRIRALMQQGDAAIAPLLAKVQATLQSGGQVWMVGVPKLPEEGEMSPSVSPNPGPRASAGRYLEAWEKQLGLFLFEHAEEAFRVPVELGRPVHLHERLSLLRLRGWRE